MPSPTQHHLDLLSLIRALSPPLTPISSSIAPEIKPLENIRAVVFDIYGTLLISASGDIGIHQDKLPTQALTESMTALHFQGDLSAAGKRGAELLTSFIQQEHAQAKQQNVAHPEVEIREIWKTVFSQLTKENLIAHTPDEKAIETLAIEYECKINPTWPMPNAKETLEQLRQRGLLLGIVSNAQFYTPLVFEALFNQSLPALGFGPCVFSYEHKKAKPDTELYRIFQRHCEKLDPQQILYVGNDMLNDIWAASQAGFRTAIFAGDQRSLRLRADDPRCQNLRTDVILTNLNQLLEIL